MRNIATKVDNVGDELSAGEWNSTQDELENTVTSTGQTLDPGAGADTDLNMLAKAMAVYAATGQYYADSGVANAYVLTNTIATQSVPSYKDGMTVTFKADNPNTGASTINIAGIGVKDLTQYDGTSLDANNVNTNDFITAIYNATSDRFEIKGIVDTQFSSGTVCLFGNSTAPVGWTRKSDWQDGSMITYKASGSPSTGGSTDPKATHVHTGPSHNHGMQNHTHGMMNHTHSGPNHTHTTAGHALTSNEMPSHTHSVKEGGPVPGGSGEWLTSGDDMTNVINAWSTTSAAGGSASHGHGNTGYEGTGNTGIPSTGNTGGPSNNNTTEAGTGYTGANSAPYYVEFIAATKD